MTITIQDLPEILEKHSKWLRSEEGGSRANLSGSDLSEADLSEANLFGSDLSGANLSEANLFRANLSGACLGEKAGRLVDGRNFLQLGPIGSRNDYALFFKTENGLFVRAGCFFDTISAFAKSVRETHAGTDHETHYKAAIALAEKVLK